MDAVGRVDAKSRFAGLRDHFIDGGRAIALCRLVIDRQIAAYRNLGIGKAEMDGLIFVMADIGEVDR
jgi:hypothetical protein